MSELVEKIAQEIKKHGVVPFARFMELALYCPVYGYYEKETDRVGRHGDYFTSVSVGSLFGELLGCQFAEWLSEVQSPRSMVPNADRAQVVEAGAHDGALAKDILAWMRAWRPGLFERLEYWIVEPSERRRQWQQEALAEFGNHVRWAADLCDLLPSRGLLGGPSEAEAAAQLPRGSRARASRVVAAAKGSAGDSRPLPRGPRSKGVREIIFSNELLDALPVHRLGWDAKAGDWFEWGVTRDRDRFVWTKGVQAKLESPGSAVGRLGTEEAFDALKELSLPDKLLEVLPDGFTIEVCPLAMAWWRAAARALNGGRLLTIDYGLSTEEWLRPERKDGTLRAYYRHHLNSDLLARPGQQDLTAHVNFSSLQAAGESAGLKTEYFVTQARFLTRIAAPIWSRDISFGEWDGERTRQFQTLTHPEHLGHAFKVLVQSLSP